MTKYRLPPRDAIRLVTQLIEQLITFTVFHVDAEWVVIGSDDFRFAPYVDNFTETLMKTKL